MRRALVVLACVVGAAIAAVGALAAFGVIHAYRLTGSSMEPTLHCARPGSGCLGSRADRVATVRKWLVSPLPRRPRRGAGAGACGGRLRPARRVGADQAHR